MIEQGSASARWPRTPPADGPKAARSRASGHRPGGGKRVASIIATLALFAALLAEPATARFGTSGADAALLRLAGSRGSAQVSVIVREVDPSSARAERIVRGLGGAVLRELPIMGGFAARLPGGSLAALARSGAISRVWADGRIAVSSTFQRYNDGPPNTVWTKSARLPSLQSGQDGSGVTVALLDTGVSHVPDLGDRVVARVDFTPEHDGYDHYGHGTHMAGIIAGDGTSSAGKWRGVATNAKLVSVKVAGADGSTDVSMVIAGMQWVIAHKNQFGLRVMNLSFGTDSTQGYAADPLDYAVEQVWLSGIVVVVSAGNRGPVAGTISKPGDDPYAISVGAADVLGTPAITDDVVTIFSSHGPTPDGMAKPDLVAPGVTIVSNRAAGSTLDLAYPDAGVDDDYFRGTGTSQAAAIATGVAALVIQSNPSITPDVVKATLAGTSNAGMAGLDGAGAGMVDAKKAISAAARHAFDHDRANQGLVPSTGTGTLDGSRGTVRVLSDFNGDGIDDAIAGEMDPLGNSWDGASWGATAWEGSVWRPYVSVAYGWGSSKEGKSWDGTSWDTSSWEGNSWDGNSWEGNSWGHPL